MLYKVKREKIKMPDGKVYKKNDTILVDDNNYNLKTFCERRKQDGDLKIIIENNKKDTQKKVFVNNKVGENNGKN